MVDVFFFAIATDNRIFDINKRQNKKTNKIRETIKVN